MSADAIVELHSSGQQVGGVLNAVGSAQIHSAAGHNLEHHVPITVVPRCFVQVVPSECELIEGHCRARTQIRRKVAQPGTSRWLSGSFYRDIDLMGAVVEPLVGLDGPVESLNLGTITVAELLDVAGSDVQPAVDAPPLAARPRSVSMVRIALCCDAGADAMTWFLTVERIFRCRPLSVSPELPSSRQVAAQASRVDVAGVSRCGPVAVAGRTREGGVLIAGLSVIWLARRWNSRSVIASAATSRAAFTSRAEITPPSTSTATACSRFGLAVLAPTRSQTSVAGRSIRSVWAELDTERDRWAVGRKKGGGPGMAVTSRSGANLHPTPVCVSCRPR